MQLEKYTLRTSEDHAGYIFVSVGEQGHIVKVVEYTINRFLEEITDNHELFGFRNNEWEKFEQNAQYEAFRMRRKQSRFEL